LLVFEGDGKVSDFPGNYTQYRQWQSLQPKSPKATTAQDTPKKNYRNDTRRRMSFKEKMEFERLTNEIEQLETEQRQIEEALCSGTLSIDELTEKSKRLPILKDELDEKSLRWLELSEIEN
jgi:ATP-binding cassette subfamily F protein uup